MILIQFTGSMFKKCLSCNVCNLWVGKAEPGLLGQLQTRLKQQQQQQKTNKQTKTRAQKVKVLATNLEFQP